jgi:hypothetical protein
MDIIEQISRIGKVPEEVRKHKEILFTVTERYRFKQVTKYIKLNTRKFSVANLNRKKWFYVALIAFAAILIAASIKLVFFQESEKAPFFQSRIKPSAVQYLDIGIYGSLETAEYSRREIRVEKGDIILIYPPTEPVQKITRGGMSQISLAEMLTFTLPGSQEKLWLGDTMKPTAITCLARGDIRFGLEYPETFSEFATYVKDGENYRGAPLNIKIEWVKNKPQDYAQPRQIARPKGIVGAFFPEWTIEKVKRNFDLQLEAKKGFSDFINRFK